MTTLVSGFYVVGGTVPRDAPSYVVRRADQELLEALRHGEFCYALTPRQMGKSSLMVRAAARLREEGFVVAILDLTAIGHNLDEERWYDGLLNRLGAELGLEEELDAFWLSHPRLSPLQRWFAALREVALPSVRGDGRRVQEKAGTGSEPRTLNPEPCRRLVIFIDEIDAVRNLPFSADEFFAAIRECYNRRAHDPEFNRVTFCLLGVATPADLIRDTRTTPFNVGRRIELADFTEAEAAPLAAGLEGVGRRVSTRGYPTPDAQRLLRRVLYWTGGHPYLTQRLCHAVAEVQSTHDSPLTAHQVDSTCAGLFFSADARERDDNLIFVRDRLLRSEEDTTALLDLYAQVRQGRYVPVDETNPLVSILRLSGITRLRVADRASLIADWKEPDSIRNPQSVILGVRNRIYARVFDREWARQHMPGAEVRRQQVAFRRGLVRAGALASGVVLVVAMLAFAALGNAARANHHRQTADRRAMQLAGLAERLQTALTREAEARRHLQEALAAERAASGRADREAQRAGREAKAATAAQERAETARQRADAARQNATRRLWSSYLAQARAGRWSRRPGQRYASLAAIARAARIRPTLELRNEAIASMALPVDLRLLSPWPDGPLDREAIAVDAAFRHYALGDLRGNFRIRRVADHREIARLPAAGTEPSEWHPGFSPDGRYFAAAYEGEGGRVVVWELRQRQVVLDVPGWGAGFSADSRRLACSHPDGSLRLYDLEIRQEVKRLVPPSRRGALWVPEFIAFGPGNRCLAATRGETGKVLVYDLELDRQLTILSHPDLVKCIAWHPDGRRLATGSIDHKIYLWDLPASKPSLVLAGHQSAATRVAFSHSGRLLASTGYDRVLRLWDPVTGQELASSPGASYTFLQFGPGDRKLGVATAGSRFGLWEVMGGRELRAVHGHPDVPAGFWQVHFSPDGRLIASGGRNDSQVWEVASGRPIALVPEPGKQAVVFLPDGRHLLTHGERGLQRWTIESGPAGSVLRVGAPELLYSQAFSRFPFVSRSGRTLAAAEASHGLVLDLEDPSRRVRFLPHPGVSFVAFSPDERWVATGTWHGAGVKVWDTRTGRLERELPVPGKTYVAFSPDGRQLVTGAPTEYVFWDTHSWRRELAVPRENSGRPGYLALSPDGRLLAVAHSISLVKLLDAHTGREMATLESPDPQLLSWLCFSPDGAYLAAACETHRIQLWDLRRIRRRLEALGLDWNLPRGATRSGSRRG
jgi:WD40 repeat protein